MIVAIIGITVAIIAIIGAIIDAIVGAISATGSIIEVSCNI